jgi:hypothetical protein
MYPFVSDDQILAGTTQQKRCPDQRQAFLGDCLQSIHRGQLRRVQPVHQRIAHWNHVADCAPQRRYTFGSSSVCTCQYPHYCDFDGYSLLNTYCPGLYREEYGTLRCVKMGRCAVRAEEGRSIFRCRLQVVPKTLLQSTSLSRPTSWERIHNI